MADEEQAEVTEEVDINVITGFDVIPATVGGWDSVVLLIGNEEGHTLYAVAAEDALEMAGAIKSVASTVRPFTVQQRINEALAAKEEDTNG